MKYLLLTIGTLFVYAACTNDHSVSSNTTALDKNGLTLSLEANPEWQHENLRLYPVMAASAPAGSGLHVKTLAEAMQTPGFRVLERKQFGRDNDVWYHALTIQNKTQDTVFIMSGDVVTGGNQDRVMAHHEIVLPGTVRNVEVYCVEAGRSHYYDQTAPESEQSVGAFKGYYNVASPQVRHAVQTSGNQNEVWSAVARITEANGAESSTKAYAALENETEQKARRDEYLDFFKGKLSYDPNVVGVVAVCGNRVLGIDIFNSNDLFQRQFPALLHGYVAEVALHQDGPMLDAKDVSEAFAAVARQASPTSKPTDEAGKFNIGGTWVHLFKK